MMGKAIRELLELPEKWQREADLLRDENILGCMEELQSALEAADIEGMSKRIEELNKALTNSVHADAFLLKRIEELEAERQKQDEELTFIRGERDRLLIQNSGLEAQLERVRNYAQHAYNCNYHMKSELDDCNCGLQQALETDDG